MASISTYIKQDKSFQRVNEAVENGQRQLITGLSSSSRAVHLYHILQMTQKTILVVVPNVLQGQYLFEDLASRMDKDQLHLFSVDDALTLEMAVSSPEIHGERVQALRFLLTNKAGIVICPLAGLKHFLPPADDFEQAKIQIDFDHDVDVDQLADRLLTWGYQREKMVASPGEFSIRGGIIDVFPLQEEHPVRIELFDVEVDSIRLFDVESQRSIGQLDELTLLPARESFFLKDWKRQAAKKLEDRLEDHPQLEDPDAQENYDRHIENLRLALEEDDAFDGLDLYASWIYPDEQSIVDYLPQDALLVFDEYPRIVDQNRIQEEENQLWVEDKLESGQLLGGLTLTRDFRQSYQDFDGAYLYYAIFEKGMGNIRLDRLDHIPSRPMQQFFSQMELLASEFNRWKKQDYAVVITASNTQRQKEIQTILNEYQLESFDISGHEDIQAQHIHLIPYPLRHGFEWPDQKLAVITEKELFNRLPKKKSKRVQLSNAEKLKSYNDLKKGDYVVHINHGIGRYLGIETMEIAGNHQDYLTLLYRNDSKVYVPVDQMHLVQKYIGSEGKAPRLHKLGGTEWTKTKQKVRQQVEDISEELIALYAEREKEEGFAFSADNDYQREFEQAFPYTETEDQLKSIVEVKADMEKEKPMDRLLIGDVGYGKTEVALRAIFKAVQDGKQAAFLVPTTVLAQQHYQSILERFEGFPVMVGILSRFRTKNQQEETIQALKEGRLDVVVGTHRLLSKDVEFKDLGLLVVDEEQRFGVKHKERLKQLKNEVDVLTLTATPIPRTLHMSMVGVRDLSVIETPPANRYPVQTYVMERNAGAIRQAIEREMARDGQVFYLHNRVSTMQQRVSELEALIPDARIAYAHGQMGENQLEDVLYRFLEGEFDILVTTTIIETGVDMPNVNTLIVEEADRMGLSQLYQLRGRVGRSNRVAYAYFTYEANKTLKEESVKRLQALRDFSELGSGFKIAMRDLSIRGAGDLLGKQQSGFIDSVGYDMYTQLLEEAIQEKSQKDQGPPKVATEINMDVEAYIPETYIEDEFQKIDMYKRMNRLSNEEEFSALQADLIDRFGDYPPAVDHLLAVSRLKMYAQQAGIEHIDQEIRRRDQIIQLTFAPRMTQELPGPEIFRALQDIPVKVDVRMKADAIELEFFFDKKEEDSKILAYLIEFSSKIVNYLQGSEDKDKEDQD